MEEKETEVVSINLEHVEHVKNMKDESKNYVHVMYVKTLVTSN